MNKIFKVVWNANQQCYQAVSEISKSHTSTSSSTQTVVSGTPIIRWSIAAVISVASMQALAAPTEGVVTAGTASISQSGTVTEIHQSTPKAAINWQQFSIKADETVNFRQPDASSVTLNRVIGNEKSVIDGAMNANGKVFIQNPSGTLIGKNAQINVGGLVATTANISDDDFMNGRYQFNGSSQGAIENLGHISVPEGGVVALIAPIVKNGGTITAPKANVLLASAERFRITLPDNQNFAYTLDQGTLQGLVDNGGAILADGGHVVLTAKGIDTVKKSLIKHSSVIEANTVQNKNGVIELLGDLDNSRLEVSGTLKAEAKEQGDGGFIETSASQLDISEQANISTHAENGKTGTWLIDPKDFTVASSGGDTTGALVSKGLEQNNVTLKSRDGVKEGKGDVVINDEISWNKNTLTVNAENDIHIDKTLTGTGTAKLALEYGQGTADGGESDYYIKQGAKVNLPEGQNLDVKKGSNGKIIHFDVIHEMPKIDNKTGYFSNQNIAFGKDINLEFTQSNNVFNGWVIPKNSLIFGLGHRFDNLTLNGDNDFVGLFQKLDGGILRDMEINNFNISTKNPSFTGGALGGAIDSKIFNVSTSGNISSHANGSATGGVAGALLNTNIINSKSISNISASTAATSSTQISHTGGLIGLIIQGKIQNSFSNGKITSETAVSSAGGLAGFADDSSVENSYSISDVTSRSTNFFSSQSNYAYSGGLLGGVNNSVIKNSYSVLLNSFDSHSNKMLGVTSGGLIGIAEGVSIIQNNYSNKNNSIPLIGTTSSSSQINNSLIEDNHKLKQKSTFTDWDFDTVWRIDEGNDYPRLRALTEGTIIVIPNKTDVGVQAHDLKKVYDGETVSTEEQLRTIATANGYSDIVSVSGLKDGDTLSSLGELTYGGTWQGARDAGKYSIVPSGLNGGQKYEIKYGEGSLTIDKRPLTIIAMNNIKPEDENNPDVSRIGVLVDGLVKGEKISNVPLSYSDNKKSQGDISLIRVGEPTFATGLASNYEITKKDGKLLTVQKEYALGDLAKNADYISQVKTSLNAVEDAMLLAKAVYGKDGSKVGSADSFYEVDKDLNLVPYSVNNPNKKFEIVQNDPILGNPLIDLSESGDGLSAALYRKVGSDEYFLVFRGTNQLKDWSANINQALSNIIDDATYLRAYHFSKNIVEKIQDNKMGKVTIVGHSLGGGLAMYSAGRIGSNIPAITFNTAALGPASRNRVNQNYGNQVPPFEHYIFDNDILSKLIENHPGTRYKVNLLPTNSSIADHLMSHVVKTQRLANLLHENNEIVEKCASNCTKLQEHQWTPAVGQYMPANPNYGSLIRNHIISNIEKEKSWAQNKKGDIVKHPGYVLNPNKPIALLDSAGGRLPTKPISIQKGSGLGQMEFALSTWNVEHNDVVSTLNKPVRIQFTDGSWVELDAYTKIRFEFDDQNDGALIADRIVLISGKILTKGTQK